MELKLNNVVLIGRTFDEYRRMFNLDLDSLRGARVLDVASGVSSFCAQATAAGLNITATDRIYMFDADAIATKAAQDLDEVMGKVAGIPGNFLWTEFGDIGGLRARRKQAYTTFVAHYRQNPTRYRYTNYPDTDFDDNQFDLTLVSHFLLLYDDVLGETFHRATLRELLRVTVGEVRIFPLLNLRSEVSPLVEALPAHFPGHTFERVKVPYEFIRGADEMLVIKRR